MYCWFFCSNEYGIFVVVLWGGIDVFICVVVVCVFSRIVCFIFYFGVSVGLFIFG